MKKSKFCDLFSEFGKFGQFHPQISVLYVKSGRSLLKSEIVLIVSSCATLHVGCLENRNRLLTSTYSFEQVILERLCRFGLKLKGLVYLASPFFLFVPGFKKLIFKN
jgi:hypothetical protein